MGRKRMENWRKGRRCEKRIGWERMGRIRMQDRRKRRWQKRKGWEIMKGRMH